jgi:6-phosphogluconolactonase
LPEVQVNTGIWQVFDTRESLVAAVVDHIVSRLEQAITTKGEFHLVFPGGRSVVPILQALVRRQTGWQGVHLYLTDERCVPRGDSERNDRLVDDFLLSQIDADGVVLHRIPAELGPDQGAAEFAHELSRLPEFDLVLLGMGEDGHTASLFIDSLDEEVGDVMAVHHSPKPPPERVSLGYARLNSAHECVAVVLGEAKRPVIAQIRSGQMFPIIKASPDRWFITADAYS